MIKERKHPIARALFVDKSDLAEREKEDLEFVDKLLSSETELFHSRYEILASHHRQNLYHINHHNHQNHQKTHKHHHSLHNHHHQMVENDLITEPGPVTTSYLAFIFWQIIVWSKLTR
uniref:Uncharacterized protein n=1 Tax=Tetranychus urticae TaxID=32264 RepID=T1KXZ5_TETUR